MARDVYFREDILNVLRAAHCAGDGARQAIDEFLQTMAVAIKTYPQRDTLAHLSASP